MLRIPAMADEIREMLESGPSSQPRSHGTLGTRLDDGRHRVKRVQPIVNLKSESH